MLGDRHLSSGQPVLFQPTDTASPLELENQANHARADGGLASFSSFLRPSQLDADTSANARAVRLLPHLHRSPCRLSPARRLDHDAKETKPAGAPAAWPFAAELPILLSINMANLSVFAGLGSDSLFGDSTSIQAERDAGSPYGRLLLAACHQAFHAELSLKGSKDDSPLGIDLDDFKTPRDLIKPCKRYHRNSVVQHATLCAVQMLRYLNWNEESLAESVQDVVAVSGFCAGLFPAIAAATSKGTLQYLSRAEDCFRLAILLGIESEQSRRELKSADSKSPWSVVIDGVGVEDMTEILSSYSPNQVRLSLYYNSPKAEWVIDAS